MSTVHQFPVQRNQPPAAPEEVADALGVAIDAAVVRYFTLCGAVDIERWTYREMGVRNGPTLVPLDLDAGLVERTTPALGFRIALGYAKDHMRTVARRI